MWAQLIGKVAIGGLTALALSACATQEPPRVVGVAPAPVAVPSGAVLAPAPSSAGTGAELPGATGAIIGTVTGEPGMCYARDPSGRTIKIQCPPGF